MNDNLPGEIFSDILARLPAEDLVRFTVVCKKWYSLITSTSFISLHLKRSIADEKRNHLLVRYCTDRPFQKNYSLRITDTLEHYSLRMNDTLDEYKRFNFPFSAIEGHFGVVGSCNGLICFSDDEWGYKHMVFIWNPVIRKAISVPMPNFTSQSHGHSLGFGFDSVTNDYKVVRLTYINSAIIPPEIEIYTVNTGCWRTISDKALDYIVEERSKQAYVRGSAHWLACTTVSIRNRKNLILSFDMGDEVFREMTVPDSVLCVGGLFDKIHLLAYQDSIALLHHFNRTEDPFCTMWMMKEYGKPESWLKQFKVDLRARLGRVVGMRMNGEVLFATEDGRLESYDDKVNKILMLPIRGRRVLLWSEFYVGTYTDSLVLLDKGVDFYDEVISEKWGWGRKSVKT